MASFNLGRFLKNPIKGLENAGRSLGKIGRQAAPIVGLIPGVGTVAGAAIGGLGSVLEGRKLSDSLKSGAIGGLSGLAGSKLRALLAAGKASGVGGALPNPDLSAVPGAVDSIGRKTAGELAKAGLGGFVDTAGSAGGGGLLGTIAQAAAKGLIPRNKDGSIDWGGLLGNAAKVGLPALGAYQSSKDKGKADEYRAKAIAAAEGAYNEAAPLRQMGLAGLTDPRMADVSSIFAAPRPQFRRLPA